MSKRKGWRAWGLAEDERGPVLRSPEFGRQIRGLTFGEREAWARCLERDHAPPKAQCSCGLYSAESADAARTWLPLDGVAVVGKVELLGQVIVGAPSAVHTTLAGLMPIIGVATERHVSDEYRSSGVRLVGKQRLHPAHAEAAAGLTDRYGVPFRVDPSLAESFDAAEELNAVAEKLIADARRRLAALHAGDAAGLVLFNQERTHVVLQLRSDYVDHANTWAFIGGAIERGETPTTAALREAWEEARLDPASIDAKGEVEFPGYTYVIATADWTPAQDWILPQSSNLEAWGAGWVPIAVLDEPERFPSIRLHPKLHEAWPKLRAQL